MLEVVWIFLYAPLNAALSTNPKTNDFGTSPFKDVIFPQGGISCWNNETLALNATNRIHSRYLFQCNFISHGNAWINFHLAYLEIGFDQLYSVIRQHRSQRPSDKTRYPFDSE